jgi:2-keto-4-pentenoate hydratase/2-oxohepta-3-ene-1,7-dioic acid hydratase in catechol pathway
LSVGEHASTARSGSLAIDRPSKIIAVGLNYEDHASSEAKMQVPERPLLFAKWPAA